MQITVVVRGNQEIHRKLERLGGAINDQTDAMKSIGQKAAVYFRTVGFASKGGVFGKPWAPLSPAYKKRKDKRFPGRGILFATGNMQDNFDFSASRHQVIIGNKSSQFKYHQSTAPRKKLPRRAMIGVNGPIKEMIRAEIKEDIRRKVNQA